MKKYLAVLVLSLSLLTLFGCKTTKNGYYAISSFSELKGLLKENRENYYYRTEDLAPSVDSVGNQADSKKTSNTNNQTAGIDEGDVVKVDTNYIYYINQNRLLVVKHDDLTVVLDETLSLDDNSYAYFSELYIYGNYLIVIGHGYDNVGYDDGSFTPYPASSPDMFYFRYGRSITTVFIYNKTTLTKEKTYQVPGYLLSSRLKEDKLYLVSNQNIYGFDDETDPRPFFKVDDDYTITNFNQIKTHESIVKEAFTIFTTITLDKDLDYKYDVLLGPGYFDSIYFSENRLYMTYYTWGYDEVYHTTGNLVAYDFKDNFSFKGINTFKGYLVNQFAIDAYNGYVRLVSTDSFGDAAKNRLYIFKEDSTLTLESILSEGIGKPRETVKSVRFNQNSVTVVTFEQTDPFYLIDLTNPKNPTITGALEVPGYSLYQHVWEEGVILGIGYEVKDNITIGIKISLYDTSDPKKLTEIGSPLVLMNTENSFQYGEALYNHKAILFDIERGFFGFSVYKSIWTENTYQSIQDYMIFDVSVADQSFVTIKKVISHREYGSEQMYLNGIDRAVYVDNYLFALSGVAISKHDINNGFERTSETLFN